MAVKSVFQLVRHDLELHYLLAYRNVRFGYVNLHFRVIDLIGQAVSNYLREVPDTVNNGFKDRQRDCFNNLPKQSCSCGEDVKGLPGSAHSIPALIFSPYPSGHSIAAHEPGKSDPVWPYVLQFVGYLCHLMVGEKTQTERQFCSQRSLAFVWKSKDRRSSLGNSNHCANFCGAGSRVVVHCDFPVRTDLIQYGAAGFPIPEGPARLNQLKRTRGDDRFYYGQSGRSDNIYHLELIIIQHPFYSSPNILCFVLWCFLCFYWSLECYIWASGLDFILLAHTVKKTKEKLIKHIFVPFRTKRRRNNVT